MKKSAKLVTMVLLVAVLSVCLTACAPASIDEITTNLEKNNFSYEVVEATSLGGLNNIIYIKDKEDKKITAEVYCFNSSEQADAYYEQTVAKEKEAFDKNIQERLEKAKDEKEKEKINKEKETFAVKKAGNFISKGYKVIVDSAF